MHISERASLSFGRNAVKSFRIIYVCLILLPKPKAAEVGPRFNNPLIFHFPLSKEGRSNEFLRFSYVRIILALSPTGIQARSSQPNHPFQAPIAANAISSTQSARNHNAATPAAASIKRMLLPMPSISWSLHGTLVYRRVRSDGCQPKISAIS